MMVPLLQTEKQACREPAWGWAARLRAHPGRRLLRVKPQLCWHLELQRASYLTAAGFWSVTRGVPASWGGCEG